MTVAETSQGVVSLTLRELSKIISRKYTMPEITYMVRISSWNFVREPKARLWAHVQSFNLKFSWEVRFLQCINSERIFWRARETLVKQPPGCLLHCYHLRLVIYSISQEICKRFCCALLCCGYAIVHNEFTWSIYPYSSGLLCWHWGNR